MSLQKKWRDFIIAANQHICNIKNKNRSIHAEEKMVWKLNIDTWETTQRMNKTKSCLLKTTLTCHLTPITKAKVKNSSESECWQDVEQREHFNPSLMEVKLWTTTLEISWVVSHKTENSSTSRASYNSPGCVVIKTSHYTKEPLVTLCS